MIGRTFLGGLLLAFPVAFADMLAPEPAPAMHEVRMIQDGNTYRFQPARITIRRGDQVKFVTVSGAPHNVAFDPAKVPDAAERALSAGMPNQMSPLAGPLLTKAGDSYTISFANVAPGTYSFFCMPHMGMGMQGTVIIQ
ncbi:MAG TPA: plastocyanin/azurin family copper-binding protein [Longimicrobiaceae bacterium]|nr:plastocyanin/azurin family copper-binding protein [Longimicrobiaceae bacterium]